VKIAAVFVFFIFCLPIRPTHACFLGLQKLAHTFGDSFRSSDKTLSQLGQKKLSEVNNLSNVFARYIRAFYHQPPQTMPWSERRKLIRLARFLSKHQLFFKDVFSPPLDPSITIAELFKRLCSEHEQLELRLKQGNGFGGARPIFHLARLGGYTLLLAGALTVTIGSWQLLVSNFVASANEIATAEARLASYSFLTKAVLESDLEDMQKEELIDFLAAGFLETYLRKNSKLTYLEQSARNDLSWMPSTVAIYQLAIESTDDPELRNNSLLQLYLLEASWRHDVWKSPYSKGARQTMHLLFEQYDPDQEVAKEAKEILNTPSRFKKFLDLLRDLGGF